MHLANMASLHSIGDETWLGWSSQRLDFPVFLICFTPPFLGLQSQLGCSHPTVHQHHDWEHQPMFQPITSLKPRQVEAAQAVCTDSHTLQNARPMHQSCLKKSITGPVKTQLFDQIKNTPESEDSCCPSFQEVDPPHHNLFSAIVNFVFRTDPQA